MSMNCILSNVSEDYLTEFKKILYEMVQDMTNNKVTDSISNDFIVQMVPHHRAAIEMGKNVLRYTTNICVQDIALNIIESQTGSMEDMLASQDICREQKNSIHDLFLYNRNLDRISEVMFARMGSILPTNNININFLREMIPHHEGAIQMANNALNYDICYNLKPILNDIILSQRKSMMMMQNLLAHIA